MQSNRLWRKSSDTDMTPYKDPILDRWAQGLTAAEIAAEIPELTHDQVRNFVSNEALKRDEARDERIDPVAHHAAKMARRQPQAQAHGPLLCPELGLERVEKRVVNRHGYENGGQTLPYVAVSLPRLRFMEGANP